MHFIMHCIMCNIIHSIITSLYAYCNLCMLPGPCGTHQNTLCMLLGPCRTQFSMGPWQGGGGGAAAAVGLFCATSPSHSQITCLMLTQLHVAIMSQTRNTTSQLGVTVKPSHYPQTFNRLTLARKSLSCTHAHTHTHI